MEAQNTTADILDKMKETVDGCMGKEGPME